MKYVDEKFLKMSPDKMLEWFWRGDKPKGSMDKNDIDWMEALSSIDFLHRIYPKWNIQKIFAKILYMQQHFKQKKKRKYLLLAYGHLVTTLWNKKWMEGAG
jgi:hypothetical protein